MTSDITIVDKDLSDKEIFEIARLHVNSINKGFLSQLGEAFLFYVYKSMDEAASVSLIAAKNGNSTVGYVSGGAELKETYRILVRRYFLPTVASILPRLLGIKNFKKIIEVFFYPKTRCQDSVQKLPSCELLSIAVDVDCRGKGVAERLFAELIEKFKASGVSEFKIVVGARLTGAQRFYEKMGAVKVLETEVHQNEVSYVYVYTIKNDY